MIKHNETPDDPAKSKRSVIKLTSRERLLAVMNGEIPDRVPISTYELCGYNSKSFENQEESYRKLMQLIREQTDAITMWNPNGNERLVKSSYPASISEERFEKNGYHVIRTIIHTPSRDLQKTVKHQDSVKTYWQVEHPCKDLEDVDALMNLPYEPVQYQGDDYPRIAQETGEHGIIMSSIGDPICTAMEIMEFGEATIWAITEPDHFMHTLEELHRRNMCNLKNMLECQPVDLYRIYGPEYATPPYLSPKHFERYVARYLGEMVDLIHGYGKKVRIHSHGRIGQVLDLMRETGADGLDPCEEPPDGDISLAEIKRKVGNRMCIFGNLELKLLENGSEVEVRNAVQKCMASAKEGGRFVIMPTASPINIPLSPKTAQNYRIFIEEALRLGKY